MSVFPRLLPVSESVNSEAEHTFEIGKAVAVRIAAGGAAGRDRDRHTRAARGVIEPVGAGPAIECVGAGQSGDRVVSGQAIDDVAAETAAERVAERRPG